MTRTFILLGAFRPRLEPIAGCGLAEREKPLEGVKGQTRCPFILRQAQSLPGAEPKGRTGSAAHGEPLSVRGELVEPRALEVFHTSSQVYPYLTG